MGSVTIVSSGTVTEDGSGTIGTRHIASRYPLEQGLTAGNTLQTESTVLEEDC